MNRSRIGQGFFLSVAIAVLSTPVLAFDYGQGRGMGGAGVAAVADHSAIELNPAGISQLPRYSVGSLFYHQKNAAAFGFSIVDNLTSPMAMGVDYRNIRPIEGDAIDYGALLRHRLTLSMAEYYENRVHLGFSYKFEREKLGLATGITTGTEKNNNHNFSTGLIVPVNDYLRIGFVSYDLLWFTKNAPDPRIASGIAVSPHEKIVISADTIQITDSIRHWQAAIGLEILAIGNIALRAGWFEDFYKPVRRMIWSTGLGWFFPKGQMSYSFNTEPNKGTVSTQKRLRHSIAIELNVK